MARRKKSPLTIVVVLVVCAIAWYFQNAQDLVSEAGDYEVLAGCTLVDNRGNDGDSFRVLLPTGKEKTMRTLFRRCPGERSAEIPQRGDQ